MPASVGSAPPDFEFVLDGETKKLSDVIGKEALAAGDFKDTVDFYLLNCSNDAAAMADFAKKNNVGTAMMHGGLVDDPGTCGAYGVQFIPHKVVIDKDGIVQHNGTGDIKGKIAEVAA